MTTLPMTSTQSSDQERSLYIGLMSGTSLDGVDSVLLDFSASRWQVIGAFSLPMPTALRELFLSLQQSGYNELHFEALAANALARLYAQCVSELLAGVQVHPAQITALGAHGQTVRHQPGLHDGVGYTRQVINSALLAELSGIDVISDFRSRDIAARGQGAPLVPGFHAHMFASAQEARVVCNIGGVANLTVLPIDSATNPKSIIGFDCGPGNILLDYYAQTYLGKPYDEEGCWAASGQLDTAFLAQLMSESFFKQAPPKSTGRDLFNASWLEKQCDILGKTPSPIDMQATLAHCTAQAIAQAAQSYGGDAHTLILCGGGARNIYLVKLLQQALSGWSVMLSDELGVPTQEVEASAFAWLAWCFMRRAAGNLPSVTGAAGPRVLGAHYPR